MQKLGSGEIGGICPSCLSDLNIKGELAGFTMYCLYCPNGVIVKDNKRIKAVSDVGNHQKSGNAEGA